MKRINEILPWESLSRKAFWDRSVPLATWRQGAQEGHRSYLPGAVAAFDTVEFVHYYGVDAFKADWPRLRQSIEAGAAQRLPLFDIAWSRLVSGSWNVSPDQRIASLPARKRDFLFAVARRPGENIYAMANALGMQYKRAHGHARDLCDAGLLRMQPSIDNGRMRNLLFPVLQKQQPSSPAARLPLADHFPTDPDTVSR